MVNRSKRTSKKRKYRTPGGDTRIEYHKRKNIKLKCSKCGKELLGIPTRLAKYSKTQRVPNRPYAGVLCSSCSRKVHKLTILDRLKQLIGVEK